mmetsp:Transcript_8334/g.19983  ORF Transcript_8334/g.19983 Transcript_8334/m.19983 type:complete len:302 (+) Transcript_8334:1195-2100(+)
MEVLERDPGVVVQCVGHNLHAEVLEGVLLCQAEPPEGEVEVGADLVVDAASAVLQHYLHDLAGGDHVRLRCVAREDLGCHIIDRGDVFGVREEGLSVTVDEIVERHQDVVKVVDGPLRQALVESRPQGPHPRGDARGEVGEVGHDLDDLLKDLLAVGAGHLVHEREEDLLELRVHLRHRRHRLEHGRDRPQAAKRGEHAAVEVVLVLVTVLLLLRHLEECRAEVLAEGHRVGGDLVAKLLHDALERHHEVLVLDLAHEAEEMVEQLREDRLEGGSVVHGLDKVPDRDDRVHPHRQLGVLEA